MKNTLAASQDNSSCFVYISYYFPPIQSVAVIRNYHLARSLKDHFDAFHIFTTSNQKLLKNDFLPDSDLKIHLLPTLDYRTLAHWFGKKKASSHFTEPVKNNIFVRFLIKLNETLPFSLFFGEGGWLYTWQGYLKIKKFLRTVPGPKFIFTSYRPAANILMGYFLKRNMPDVIWMTSFHDVPVDTRRNNVFFPGLQHWFYKKLLSKADLNISVSEGVSRQLEHYSSKQIVIRNGISIRENPLRKRNEKFTICYTGSLYLNLRNPSPLFEVLRELIADGKCSPDTLTIQYSGKDGALWYALISEYQVLLPCTRISDEVPYTESLRLQEQADINLLLTWTDQNQQGILTGKLYEYIGSLNPILCIVKGNTEDTELNRIFSDLQCGVVCYEDEPSKQNLKAFICNMYEQWKKNDTYAPYISTSLLSSLTWGKQADKIIAANKNFDFGNQQNSSL